MSYDHHSITEDYILDRQALRHAARDTYGSPALHGLDPSEILCQIEEATHQPHLAIIHERQALRNEILSGFIEYAFCDGPDPYLVRQRIAGFIASYDPAACHTIKAVADWIQPAHVRFILRKPAYLAKLRENSTPHRETSLAEWHRELAAEIDTECVESTITEIIRLIRSQGSTWRTVVAVAYSLAKALHPHLLAGMSLADIAALCGDKGRATSGHRTKRIYNRRLEAAGAKSTHVPYQKTETTIAKYKKAQIGNQNRTLKIKNRRKKS